MSCRQVFGRPAGILLLLAAIVLLSQVEESFADKEKHHEGYLKVLKVHHRAPTHHLHAPSKDYHAEPTKKTYHHPTTAPPTAAYHRTTTPKAKAPAGHHYATEHHVDKHSKHRLEEPKRRLEEQKPPKPFLQPPLLPKHQERPNKHHYARQEKEKHH